MTRHSEHRCISKGRTILLVCRSFIKLSIVLGFGSKVYDYIANNRKLVPVGHCRGGVCEIPTKNEIIVIFLLHLLIERDMMNLE